MIPKIIHYCWFGGSRVGESRLEPAAKIGYTDIQNTDMAAESEKTGNEVGECGEASASQALSLVDAPKALLFRV